jgi:hypothetical protein
VVALEGFDIEIVEQVPVALKKVSGQWPVGSGQ